MPKPLLNSAEAALATAEDALSYTELKADTDGIITARNLEVGQVVSAAQSAFTLAHDGPERCGVRCLRVLLSGRPARQPTSRWRRSGTGRSKSMPTSGRSPR